MARSLKELKIIQNCYLTHDDKPVPIFYTGDIFDKWNPGPELINFAIENLPKGYAIPGQHDLPYHIYENWNKSAFGTLVKAGVLSLLTPVALIFPGKRYLKVHGFGWGQKLKRASPSRRQSGNYSRERNRDDTINLAIIHAYCWRDGHSFPGCPQEQHVEQWITRLTELDYTMAAFGDNHIGFHHSRPSTEVTNGGTFMIRRADEVTNLYKPFISLIHQNGTFSKVELKLTVQHYSLGTEDPKKEEPKRTEEMKEFLDGLTQLGEQGFEFESSVKRFMEKNKTNSVIRQIILKAMEPK